MDLRQRRKLETTRLIHETAVQLARQGGVDGVTVEAICAASVPAAIAAYMERVQALPGIAPVARPADATGNIGTHDSATPENPRDALVLALEGFNTPLERVAEVAVVMLVGALLSHTDFSLDAAMLVILLLVVVRPLSVWVGLLGERVSRDQRILISWFGIRGIGSVYYLLFAINHGLPPALARELTALTLTAVTVSIVVHGMSVTPLMRRYRDRVGRRKRDPS